MYASRNLRIKRGLFDDCLFNINNDRSNTLSETLLPKEQIKVLCEETELTHDFLDYG